MQWYLKVLTQYADFNGRARRQEYWMFFLVNLIITIAIGFVEGSLGSAGALGVIYSLAVFIPFIAVSMRRLHDTGRSGWWLFIGFIPLVGSLVLLIFMLLQGVAETNDYGEDPKIGDALMVK
mgnify:FL=1